MKTKLDEIAAKARRETKLQFTSLCHHITDKIIWENLKHIPRNSASGVDGIDVKTAKETFQEWIGPMLQSVHQQGYKAPPVKRVWIPKPGKSEKRPIGIPCIADRALQRSVSTLLSAIYEQDFLACSFGGRPILSAHHALSTLSVIIAAKKVGWVYEADLKNFFGSLDHGWLLRFVKHRVGDPRIINLIQRWLKAGVLEENEIASSEVGTPQGGSVSVLLSNIYLHYVLDLWFEKVVKPRLKGEAYLIRYIDDFVVCFECQADAIRFQEVLSKRLNKFALTLEPSKTRLVEFGRFAQKRANRTGKKVETIYFLGFTHYCAVSRKGKFMVGRKTEKTRLKRSFGKVRELMRSIRHFELKDQARKINELLRGLYAYYGVSGNYRSLWTLYHYAEKYWHKILGTRSWKSYIPWEKFQIVLKNYPIQRPKLKIPSWKTKSFVVL